MKKHSFKTYLKLLAGVAIISIFYACGSKGSASATAGSQSDAKAVSVAEKIPDLPIDPDYEIEVTVRNFLGDKLFLAHYLGTSNRKQDSAELKNGKFVFKGEQSLPTGMYLVILPPRNTYFEIVVNRDQHFSIETDTADFVGNMKISGSEENELMYSDIRFLAGQREKITPLREQYQQLGETDPARKQLETQMAEIDSAVVQFRRKMFNEKPYFFYTRFIKAMQPPKVPPKPDGADEYWQYYYYRDHFFDNMDFSDGSLFRSVAMGNKVKEFMDRWTMKVPDSINKSIDIVLEKAKANDDAFMFFVPWLLNTYGIENKQMGMDAVYVHMVEKYYLSGEAWWADSATLAKMEERAMALSPNLVGRPAPNFTATDTEGKPRALHDVKGKLTILYFWDYDCGHCKTITPKMTEIYNRYRDKDVALYALSINGDVEVWKEKIPGYGLEHGINVQDHARQSGFDAMYDIRSTPRIFVLDEDKIIKYKQISVDDLEGILKHELGMEEKS